jgi:hypothetical protein
MRGRICMEQEQEQEQEPFEQPEPVQEEIIKFLKSDQVTEEQYAEIVRCLLAYANEYWVEECLQGLLGCSIED